MNKYVVNVLKQYDFTYEGNHGYGFINDYEVNVINSFASIGPTFVFSTFLSQSKKNDFIIKMNAKKIPLVKVDCFDCGVSVVIGAATAKSFEKKFPDVLASILEVLESIEAPKKDICPQSGEIIDDLDCRTVDFLKGKVKIRLSNKAIATVNSAIEKSNEDYEAAPNNYLKGFGGILIGALAGVALTVAFAFIGFVTALSPLAAIALGTFLYRKFGGKPNKTMIIMSFITTLIVILGSLVLMYVVVANIKVSNDGLDYKGFEAFTYCLDNYPKFQRLFVADLALNAFFILVAEGFSTYFLLKGIRRPKNIE